MRLQRCSILGLCASAIFAAASALPALSPRTDAAAPKASQLSVETIGFTVADLERSTAFFVDVLHFKKLGEWELAGDAEEHRVGVFGARMHVARLALGREQIELTEFLAPKGRAYPIDSRGNDRWFQHLAIVTRDMTAAYAHLREHGVVHASTGPQKLPEWNKNAAGIEAFYFRDPDQHFLEVIAFPPGKGDPRWQATAAESDELFLGIDHTAIVVGDTETSLAFYRDQIGLRIVGGSENYGVEQEHLNNVFGARLRITTLHAASGPGIELLEYLAPRDGRPAPADLKANDLAHWQTRLGVPESSTPAFSNMEFSNRIDELLHRGGPGAVRAAFVSPGAVDIPESTLGFAHAALLRDPDGHALELVGR